MNHFLENLKFVVNDFYYPKKNPTNDFRGNNESNNNYFSNNWITLNGYNRSNNSNTQQSNTKNDNLFSILSMILIITVISVSSIMIYFNDDYIKFKLSFLTKKMKKLDNKEIYKNYSIWYKKFIKRTRTFFYIKMYGIATLLCFVVSYFLEFEDYLIIISFSLFCLTFVMYTFKYYTYHQYGGYFENEKELYDLLISTIEQELVYANNLN